MDYSIKINEFEGPLDLLLHLIKQSNIEIQDIEISEITKQYLDYINKMEELNINIASSYIVMAAELMEIKSKSLLPKKEEDEEDDEEEIISKENLINKLIEYQKYKEITPSLKKMESSRQDIYIKSPEKLNNYLDEVIVKNDDVSVDNLVNAFIQFLERKNLEKPIKTKITNKEYSVKERKNNIKNILREKGKVIFTELFEEKNISFIIVTFLSILEMTKEKDIIIKQDTNFSNIIIELKVKE